MPDRPVFYPIDVARMTRMTSPRYGVITRAEEVGPHVLRGEGGKLLIGPLGINYCIEGTDSEHVYLRRWDQRSVRSSTSVTVVVCLEGVRQIDTYKGDESPPAPMRLHDYRPGKMARP